MKGNFLSFVFNALLVTVAKAEWDECLLPPVDWIVLDKGEGRSLSYAAVGTADGIFSAGTFQKSLSLRDSQGLTTVTAPDGHSEDDVFLGKIASNSTVGLLKSFAGNGRDLILDAAWHEATNTIAICGYFLGNITFGSTKLENTKLNYYDGFVALFDATNLTPIWATKYDNQGETKLFGVSLDNNKVVSAGYSCEIAANAPIDPNTGRPTPVCSGVILGFNENTGTLENDIVIENTSFSGIRHSSSAIVAVGSVSDSVSTSLGNIEPIGNADALVLSYDLNLNLQWQRNIGHGSSSDSAWDLAPFLDNDDIVVTGSISGPGSRSADGVGGAGSTSSNLYQGSKGGMLLFLSENGEFLGAKDVPSSRGIQVSPQNDAVYLMGLKSGGFLEEKHTLGSFDVFVAKISRFTQNGLYYLDLGGGASFEYPWSLAIDKLGDLYVTGMTSSSTIRFGDKTETDATPNDYSMFVAKVETSNLALPTCKTSCNSLATGFCFIGNICYADDKSSPYANHGCFKCSTASSNNTWTGPNSNSHCYIEDQCVEDGARNGNECQYCSVRLDSSAWSLHPAFNFDQEAGCIPKANIVVPSCGGSRTDSAFCPVDKPCYDSIDNSCYATIEVCPVNTIYTLQCPDFPAEPCYHFIEHDCKPHNFQDASVCSPGKIPTDLCTEDFPCYDPATLTCVEGVQSTNIDEEQKQEQKSVGVIVGTSLVCIATLSAFGLIFWRRRRQSQASVRSQSANLTVSSDQSGP